MSSKDNHLILYSYWRSSAAWRVRIALHLKKIPFEYCAVNLLKGEQKTEEYKSSVHPHGLVPAMKIGPSRVLTQSLAIIDYLETKYPNNTPSLLPNDPLLRAHVLELVYTIACDTHPLQNLRVLNTYAEDARGARAKNVINAGLQAFECLLTHSELYCVGDVVTLADVVMVPQFYNAVRWDVDVDQFPKTKAIYERLGQLDAFRAAHPDQQPDKPQ